MRGIILGFAAAFFISAVFTTLPPPTRYAKPERVAGTRIVIEAGAWTIEGIVDGPVPAGARSVKGDRLDAPRRAAPLRSNAPTCSVLADRKCGII